VIKKEKTLERQVAANSSSIGRGLSGKEGLLGLVSRVVKREKTSERI